MDQKEPTSGKMRWLRAFEPLMVVTGCSAAARHIAIDFQVVLHSHPAYLRSITSDVCILLSATLLWVVYGLLNRKPALYVGNIVGVTMNLPMVIGILIHAGLAY